MSNGEKQKGWNPKRFRARGRKLSQRDRVRALTDALEAKANECESLKGENEKLEYHIEVLCETGKACLRMLGKAWEARPVWPTSQTGGEAWDEIGLFIEDAGVLNEDGSVNWSGISPANEDDPEETPCPT